MENIIVIKIFLLCNDGNSIKKQLFEMGAVFLFPDICRNLSSFGQFCPFLNKEQFVIIKIIQSNTADTEKKKSAIPAANKTTAI